MDIVVCMKQVPNPCLPFEIDSETGHLKDAEWTYIINPYDEIALEQALRIREEKGNGSVVVITLGPKRAESAFRRSIAMGADEAIHVRYEAPNSLDAYSISVILAKVISTLKFSLILCGGRSIDWSNGGVGVMMGELLNMPVVTSVVKVAVSDDCSSLTVLRLLEKGDKQEVRCKLPALLTVEMTLCEPRYPSFPGIKKSLRKEISELDLGSLNFDRININSNRPLTRVVNISRPRPKKVFVPPSNLPPAERINLLISGTMKQKDSHLLEGAANQVAKSAVEFLIQKNILTPK